MTIPLLTDAELHLSAIYTEAFRNKLEWTPADHLAGLKAVFAAGANARQKQEQASMDVAP